MSIFVPNKRHLREVMLHYFFAKKTAAETHRLLVEVYDKDAPSATTCKEWFCRFSNEDYEINDKEHGRPQKVFEDEELAQLLHEDPCQTQTELSIALNVSQGSISRRLTSMGMIRKLGKWVPHRLTERDIERRLIICDIHLQRQQRKSFLHRIVTGDETWIRYDNPKRKACWVKPGEPSTSTPKQNIHGSKLMLCIWWDQKGVICYEMLKPSETMTGERYRSQLIRLKRALKEKRSEWAHRHDKVILLHDNARPHVHSIVKKYLEGVNWEVLAHPPYSPDIAPSDFHLFRSMKIALSGERFSSGEDLQKWVDSWISSKDPEFFFRGIQSLPKRWASVISANGKYFD
jgi:[histone H3]-lysine36 N-dimethyltransferase SETMAR